MGKNRSFAKSSNKSKKENTEKMVDAKANDSVKNEKAGKNKGSNSNGKTSKGDNHVNTKSASSGLSPLWLVLGLSITVGVAAIIYTNEDVQMFIVKMTPLGSKPWETLLQNSGNSADSNQAKPNLATSKDSSDTQENIDNTKTADTQTGQKADTQTGQTADTQTGQTADTQTGQTADTQTGQTADTQTGQTADPTKQQTVESETQKSKPAVDPVTDKKETSEGKQKKTARDDYPRSSITNKADFKIRKKLDTADALFKEGNHAKAAEKFDLILKDHPESPRALWGKGLVLDAMAEKQRSNGMLEEAMGVLDKALRLEKTPDALVVEIGEKLADRQGFRGWMGKEALTWKYMAERFPDKTEYRNRQGVAYLKMGKNEAARNVFQQVLDDHPDNGFALVHLGFILKTNDQNYKEAIPMLQRGVDSGEPGVEDARFYTHLGDAYHRMKQTDKAKEIYKQGYKLGLFLSEYQRSTYNAETPITGRPWWTVDQTTYSQYLRKLEKNWKTIREEGMAQLNKKSGAFESEDENLSDTGDWKQFTLFHRGRKDSAKCQKTPKTCALIDEFPAARDCTRGQVKFSVMHPGVHVWPHTGPTNCRIRAHLGLVIPEGPKIRVADDIRTWTEGKFIIFDDSFEHEVWHNGTELRLVLIVDFWHPEIPEWERRSLSPI